MQALVCCRNLNNVHSRIRILALHPSVVSPGPHAILWIWKLSNCQTTRWLPIGWSRWGSTKHQYCNSEFAKWHDIYTPGECADEWRQNKSNHYTSRQTVSQPRPMVTSAENSATENSPQLVGELDSVMDTWLILKKIYAGLAKQMVWHGIRSVNLMTPYNLSRAAWFEINGAL